MFTIIYKKKKSEPYSCRRTPFHTGVYIFAKPNIYICEKPEFHTSEIEILSLEVIINNLKAIVGVIYRPPHSDVSYCGNSKTISSLYWI